MHDSTTRQSRLYHLWLLGVPVSVLLVIFFCAVALNRTLTR